MKRNMISRAASVLAVSGSVVSGAVSSVSASSAARVLRTLVAILAIVLLVLGFVPLLSLIPGMPAAGTSFAADAYTYTVRIYQGGQGTFDDGRDPIVISGLNYGERITFNDAQMTGGYSIDVVDAQGVTLDSDTLSLADGSKFYVKGFRESGRDNNTVGIKTFVVTEDKDFVIAYGIKGDTTTYTVRYVDADGKELIPSVTYVGNVGDKPVAAYLYMEGYRPDYYNLTKTLSRDEKQNVFTFRYVAKKPIIIEETGNGSNGSGGGSSNSGSNGNAGSNSSGSSSTGSNSSGTNGSSNSSTDETAGNNAESTALSETTPANAGSTGSADSSNSSSPDSSDGISGEAAAEPQELGDLDSMADGSDASSDGSADGSTETSVNGEAAGHQSGQGENSEQGLSSKVVKPLVTGGGILAIAVAILWKAAK